MLGAVGTLQLLFSCATQIPVTPGGDGGWARGYLQGWARDLLLLVPVSRSGFQFPVSPHTQKQPHHTCREMPAPTEQCFPQGSESQLLGLLAVMTPTSPCCSPSSSDGGFSFSPAHCPTVFPVYPFCPSTSITLMSHIK